MTGLLEVGGRDPRNLLVPVVNAGSRASVLTRKCAGARAIGQLFWRTSQGAVRCGLGSMRLADAAIKRSLPAQARATV